MKNEGSAPTAPDTQASPSHDVAPVESTHELNPFAAVLVRLLAAGVACTVLGILALCATLAFQGGGFSLLLWGGCVIAFGGWALWPAFAWIGGLFGSRTTKPAAQADSRINSP